MNSGLMLDITQIPSQLSGLASVTTAIAISLLAIIIPYTTLEMNVRAAHSKNPPGYGGFAVRIIVAMTCLLCYNQLYSLMLGASQTMSFAVLSEQDWGTFLIQSFQASDPKSPVLSWLMHPLDSIQAIVLFFTSLVAVTAKDVIVMLQVCFLSLLYAFGPIAVVCAISEKTSAVTRGWVANSFQVALWSFFLRLVVRVWLTLSPFAGNTGTGLANDFLGIVTVDVSFIVMVLGTPILAARLLSGESIAAFGEAAFGAVQAVTIGATHRAGQFLSKETDHYKRDKSEFQSSWFHHPIPRGAKEVATTATAAYNAIFKGDKARKPTELKEPKQVGMPRRLIEPKEPRQNDKSA